MSIVINTKRARSARSALVRKLAIPPVSLVVAWAVVSPAGAQATETETTTAPTTTTTTAPTTTTTPTTRISMSTRWTGGQETAGPSTGQADYYIDPLTGRIVWPEGSAGYRATTTTTFTLISSYPSIDFGYNTVLVTAPTPIAEETTSTITAPAPIAEETTSTITAPTPVAEETTSTEATTRSAGKSTTTVTTGATAAPTKAGHAPPAPAKYETPNLTG